MGTINQIKSFLNEAKSSQEISGYIDMEDPQTKSTPENPAIIVIGIGKLDYETLKKDVENKTKDLLKFAKRGDFKFLYKQLGKIEDYSGGAIESPYQAYIRTLIQVEEKMKSASIIIIPSKWEEPFGLVVAEAMSNGVGIIASKIGGIPEIVRQNGILIKDINKSKLQNELEKLLNNPRKRKILQKLSWNNFEHYSKTSSEKLDNYRSRILSSFFVNN